MCCVLNLRFALRIHGSRVYAAIDFVEKICAVEISEHYFLPEMSCSQSKVMTHQILCHISSGKYKIVDVCN